MCSAGSELPNNPASVMESPGSARQPEHNKRRRQENLFNGRSSTPSVRHRKAAAAFCWAPVRRGSCWPSVQSVVTSETRALTPARHSVSVPPSQRVRRRSTAPLLHVALRRSRALSFARSSRQGQGDFNVSPANQWSSARSSGQSATSYPGCFRGG